MIDYIEMRRRDEKVDTKFTAAFSQPSTKPSAGPTYQRSFNQTRGQDEYEEIKEDSLTRLKQTHSGSKQYTVPQDTSFESFPEITSRTADKLRAKGIESLFPIQQYCFYSIYNREDMIARDLTGSGKTLAFCLPMVEYLRKERLLGKRKIQAIVLAPTRELALQVSNLQMFD